MKYLLKLLMPNAKTISSIAADCVAKAINESGKGEIIAKYDGYATKVVELQAFVTKLLADGKINDDEKKQIATMIEPIVTKIVESI